MLTKWALRTENKQKGKWLGYQKSKFISKFHPLCSTSQKTISVFSPKLHSA